MGDSNNTLIETSEQLIFKAYFPLALLLPFAVMNIINLALVK